MSLARGRVLVLTGLYRDAGGVERQMRVCSRPFAGQEAALYQPRMLLGSDPEYRVRVAAPWSRGRSVASYGAIELANADGLFSPLLVASFAGYLWDLRLGRQGQSVADMALVFRARPDRVVQQGQALKLEFRDRLEELAQPIQIHHFDEATPNPALRGQLKPMILGRPRQVPALLLDEVSSSQIQYFVGDNLSWGAAVNPREGLAPIAVGAQAGQHQLTAVGFRLNSQPSLALTASPVQAAPDTLLGWLSSMLCERGIANGSETGPLAPADLDAAAINEIDRGLTVGHYWQDATTHRDLVDRIMQSLGAAWWIDRLGRLTARHFEPFGLRVTDEDDISWTIEIDEGALVEITDGYPMDAVDVLERAWPVAEVARHNRLAPVGIERYLPEEIPTGISWRRNFQPVRPENAAQGVSETLRSEGGAEYASTSLADQVLIDQMPAPYRARVTGEAQPTAIVAGDSAVIADRANLPARVYGRMRRAWRLALAAEPELFDALTPLRSVLVWADQPVAGEPLAVAVTLMDIRSLPVSGRVEVNGVD